LVDLSLIRRNRVGLERRDQGAQTRREDDEIAGVMTCCESVCDASGYEDGITGASDFGSVSVTKRQLPFQNVPGFIIGMVHVEGGGTAAAPLMNLKRGASG